MAQSLQALFNTMPQRGRVDWLGVRPAKYETLQPLEQVWAEQGVGLVGDRYENARHRHVSLQSIDDLAASAEALGAPIDPGRTRRNLTISGPSLPTTPGTRVTIGDTVELQVVRAAAPCKIMDDAVAPGAHLAMRRRGGVICRVLRGDVIRVGDTVSVVPTPDG